MARHGSAQCLIFFRALILLVAVTSSVWSKALPNCSYPAVYSFGDSLTDVGNSIAAFPDQFGYSEEDPYGVEFPAHAADRLSDGKLLVDFIGQSCSLQN